ncbi:RNA polymerase sigma factor [Corynebacterium sp. 335C]
MDFGGRGRRGPRAARDGAGAPADGDVLAAHRSGDARAFPLLVRRYAGQMWKTARQMTGDDDVAAEVLQEALLRAHRSASAFRGDCAAATWLTTITRNCVLDRRRREANRPEHVAGHAAFDGPRGAGTGGAPGTWREGAGGSAAHRDPDRTLAIVVRDAVRTLPDHQRVVVEQVDLAGLSVGEAAGRLGLTLGTVKSRRSRARERLRRELAGPDAGGSGAPLADRRAMPVGLAS